MSRSDYALVLKFSVSERLPSYSGMEGYVPGFVDAFFERRSTRVNHNATEIWVHVDKPEHEDTLDCLNRMKNRMDTPRDELKYYESSISLFSEDVDIAHMTVGEFVDKTEHSAAIVNKDWSNIDFQVIDEDPSSYLLVQNDDSDVLISVSKFHNSYSYEFKNNEIENIKVGQKITANVGSTSGFGTNWHFESITI